MTISVSTVHVLPKGHLYMPITKAKAATGMNITKAAEVLA